MTKILVLGAAGSLARVATAALLEQTDAQLTLYLRHSKRLQNPDPSRVRVVAGDVLDRAQLAAAMVGQDVVYVNLAGDLPRMARAIVAAMKEAGLRRLIFISSMGIYDEVPAQRYRSVLDPYREAAEVVESSGLDYTVLRPGWFTNDDEVDYEITHKGEPFKGHDISRKSLAALIVKLAMNPTFEVHQSLGVSKPNEG